MGSGIFAVVNVGTLRLYVGETNQLQTRWGSMVQQLMEGRYADPDFQAEWQRSQGQRHFTFHTSKDLLGEKTLRGRSRLLADLQKQG